MKNETIAEKFVELSTPLVLDAAVRLKILFRVAPFGIAPIIAGTRAAGRALPVKHSAASTFFSKRWKRRRRAKDPAYTFRKHLRILGGAIEE